MTRQAGSYLYHYTTMDAFISIVEKQEIWASNIGLPLNYVPALMRG